MTHKGSSTPNNFKDAFFKAGIPQEGFDAFFAEGGLTVYAVTPSPWLWVICAGQRNFQATLVSPESLFEMPQELSLAAPDNLSRDKKKSGKSFEQSTLIRWLVRAAQQTTAVAPAAHYNKLADEADVEAFTRLVRMDRAEWNLLNALPSLSAAEIRYFEQSHNAALSDIESAFLPAKMELPAPLANFYIRYLTQARRNVEASLTIAQATHSTRLPRLMSDAVSISAFEGAIQDPLCYETHTYASSTLHDTAVFIDATLRIAAQKLGLPVDHDLHLLRMNVQDMNHLAADIVNQHRLHPFAFLMKAKQLFLARSDTCRLPTLQRFAISVQEHDLNMDDAWVRRLALSYDRLFEGKAMRIPDRPDLYQQPEADLLRLTRKA